MNPQFWCGKRVLVTGHTGFKGGWLTLLLQHLGAEVIGFSRAPNTTPSLFQIADIGAGIISVTGDIQDRSAVERILVDSRPDIVIHMAAQALVRHSYQDPTGTFHTNVLGTVHLLDAVRRMPSVRAVINVTSDKCYENREWIWGYRENEPMGGHDPYSSSKACAELVTASFRNSYFALKDYGIHHNVGVASARAGNVIGGGDWSMDRLIPDILRAVGEGRPVRLRSPKAIRPWQHVLEPLSGYLLLAEKLYTDAPAYAEGWNFGPMENDTHPVATVTDLITRLWGDGASWELDDTVQPHEAHYLKLDCSKAREKLNWSQRWSLEEALEQIVSWHKDYADGKNMRSRTLQDIKLYSSLQG